MMNIRYFLLVIAMMITPLAFANNVSLAKFFSSNNTQIIDAHTAYERLIGDPQENLKNEIIEVVQKNHLEQNKCEDVLGMYQMTNDQNITADNTKEFVTSPYQTVPEQVIFDMAKQLANVLKQESIGVFIPENESAIGDILVNFRNPLSITEAIGLINTKLPLYYRQAYSLHLKQKYAGYEQTKVTSVEWLGSQAKLDEVKKAFPNENISAQHGKAFLVYKNGQKQEL